MNLTKLTITLFLLSVLSFAKTTVVGTFTDPSGIPINGTVYISNPWFTTLGGILIPEQSIQVSVTGGSLSVQLEPSDTSTPTFKYTVNYSWKGNQTELWNVPTSPSTVNVTAIATRGPSLPPGITIAESQIPGLLNDLANRPTIGSPFLPSKAVITDSGGHLTTAVGISTNCIHVDGSNGTCGGGGGGGTSAVWGDVSGVTLTLTHSLGTADIFWSCYDSAFNALPVTQVVATDINTTTFTFLGSQTGRCGVSTGGMGPTGPAGTSYSPYTQSFTSQTSVVLTHSKGSKSIQVVCYDNSDNQLQLVPIVTTDNNNATVSFLASQTGRCVVE